MKLMILPLAAALTLMLSACQKNDDVLMSPDSAPADTSATPESTAPEPAPADTQGDVTPYPPTDDTMTPPADTTTPTDTSMPPPVDSPVDPVEPDAPTDSTAPPQG